MKRMVGIGLTVVGGAALIWGIVCVLSGSMSAKVAVTDEFSVTALTGGLAGAATFTLGLVWVRD